MVKADGCVAIHADGGAYKPLNWMNAPNRLITDDTAGTWTVTNPKGEQLVIRLHEILSDSSHVFGEDPGLFKDGVEAHLQALLAEHAEAVLDLSLVRREYPTDIGPVDLLCKAADGTTVAVEVKRHENLQVSQWWKQAVKQAQDHQTPFLMYRQNRTPWRFRLRASVYHIGRLGHYTVDMAAADAQLWFQTELWVRLSNTG